MIPLIHGVGPDLSSFFVIKMHIIFYYGLCYYRYHGSPFLFALVYCILHCYSGIRLPNRRCEMKFIVTSRLETDALLLFLVTTQLANCHA